MKYTVDHIENGIAFLEDDMLMLLPVPMELLPEGTREGSILSYESDAFVLCKDEETEQRKRLFALQQKLLDKKSVKQAKKRTKK